MSVINSIIIPLGKENKSFAEFLIPIGLMTANAQITKHDHKKYRGYRKGHNFHNFRIPIKNVTNCCIAELTWLSIVNVGKTINQVRTY